MERKKLLVIAGSTKCGTTSLFDYLTELKSIDGAVRKETRFFLDEDYELDRSYSYSEGMLAYKNYFKGKSNDSIWLDGTPDYLYCYNAIERITSNFANPFFVFIFRDPAKRFLSWFNYAKQIGDLENSITEEQFLRLQLTDPKNSDKQYLRALEQGRYSKYFELIRPLLNHNFVIYDFDDLKNKPHKLLSDLCQRVGIDDELSDLSFEVKNETRHVKSQSVQKVYLKTRVFFNSKTAYFPKIHRYLRRLRIAFDKVYYAANSQKHRAQVTNAERQEVETVLYKYYEEEFNWLERNVSRLD